MLGLGQGQPAEPQHEQFPEEEKKLVSVEAQESHQQPHWYSMPVLEPYIQSDINFRLKYCSRIFAYCIIVECAINLINNGILTFQQVCEQSVFEDKFYKYMILGFENLYNIFVSIPNWLIFSLLIGFVSPLPHARIPASSAFPPTCQRNHLTSPRLPWTPMAGSNYFIRVLAAFLPAALSSSLIESHSQSHHPLPSAAAKCLDYTYKSSLFFIMCMGQFIATILEQLSFCFHQFQMQMVSRFVGGISSQGLFITYPLIIYYYYNNASEFLEMYAKFYILAELAPIVISHIPLEIYIANKHHCNSPRMQYINLTIYLTILLVGLVFARKLQKTDQLQLTTNENPEMRKKVYFGRKLSLIRALRLIFRESRLFVVVIICAGLLYNFAKYTSSKISSQIVYKNLTGYTISYFINYSLPTIFAIITVGMMPIIIRKTKVDEIKLMIYSGYLLVVTYLGLIGCYLTCYVK